MIANLCRAVGSSSETWLSAGLKETAVLVNAKTAKRVIGLMAIPAIEGETVYVKKGTPELARHVVVHVETSSCAAWIYWKLLASSTVFTANEPLKFVLFVVPGGNPLMSTVPGLPGTRLWGADVLIVTTLEARVALTMAMPSEPLEGLARFTAE